MANPIKCVGCSKFVPYAEMQEGGGARFCYEPLSEFGPERCEWTCVACVERERRDDEYTAEHGRWRHA
jgi:hypothetical protein